MIIKIEFETVLPHVNNGYKFYSNEKPICKPEEVPDQYWTKVVNDKSASMGQYNQLKKWSETGEQLIRNVKLFKADDIEWIPYETSIV